MAPGKCHHRTLKLRGRVGCTVGGLGGLADLVNVLPLGGQVKPGITSPLERPLFSRSRMFVRGVGARGPQ